MSERATATEIVGGGGKRKRSKGRKEGGSEGALEPSSIGKYVHYVLTVM